VAFFASNAAAKANLGTVSLGVRDYPRARAILEEQASRRRQAAAEAEHLAPPAAA